MRAGGKSQAAWKFPLHRRVFSCDNSEPHNHRRLRKALVLPSGMKAPPQDPQAARSNHFVKKSAREIFLGNANECSLLDVGPASQERD